jgi:AcrR family transcriptional regulator
MEERMDRRQRKSREAIFAAFSRLLTKKNFSQITVSKIIDEADVGRATFYAHFETKDHLLKALCEELFCHIFDHTEEYRNDHRHIFNCDAPDSIFLHLFQHFGRNDNHILDLLSGPNNDLFLMYFRPGLIKLIESKLEVVEMSDGSELPRDFLVNHIAATFVETVRWWGDNKMQQSSEVITRYFLLAIHAWNISLAE